MLARIKTVYVMTQFVITVVVVIALMYMFRKNNRKIRRGWAKLQKYMMGYRVTKKGEIDEDAELLVINHQSLIDIILIEELHPKNICWVTKQELAKIPVFGHVVHAPRMIAVDRKDKRSMLKLFKTAKSRVKDGRVIAIFPEGTRGEGRKLLRFKKGTKFLAETLNLKIQPVVISGTRDVFDTKTMLAYSGDVSIKFLPSFYPTKDTSWFEDLQANMQKELDIELADNTSHR